MFTSTYACELRAQNLPSSSDNGSKLRGGVGTLWVDYVWVDDERYSVNGRQNKVAGLKKLPLAF